MTARDEHVRPEDAAGLVMLEEGDAERARAEAHARACPSCAAELLSARQALASLSALEDGLEASPARLGAVHAALTRALPAAGAPDRDDARRLRWASVAASAACAVLAVAVFRGVSDGVIAWVAAAISLALGVGAILSVRDESTGRSAALVAGAGALVLAMLSIEPGEGVEWEHAAYCGGTQLLGALAPAAVALFMPGARRLGGWAVLGRGAGGALVALAALLLVCPAHSATHVLGFHVASVGVAALVAAAFSEAVWGTRASARP